MRDYDIESRMLILTDKIVEMLRKEDELGPDAHMSAAASDKKKKALEAAEVMIHAGMSLLGGALADLNRIANALEVIAANQQTP